MNETNRPATGRNIARGLSRRQAGYLASMFLLVLLAPCWRAPAQNCLQAPAGLVGWWPGDGNGKDILGTNNGILQGGATANAAGVVGAAFSLDGTNGYVQIPDAPELKPTNLTVECWVRFSSLDTPGNSTVGAQYIVFKQNTRPTIFEGYNLSKHRYAYDIIVWEVSSADGVAVQLNGVTAITSNVWYHLAGVRGPTLLQLYINGQLEAQTNLSFPQNYGNYPLYFGTSGQSYWEHKLAGSLDEVSLYNRALTSNEIASLYAAGSAGKCKAPAILVQPQDQFRYWGGSVTYTSSASGVLPLSYRWLKGSSPVPNATNPSLAMTNLQLTNAGSYALLVTNALGSITSSPALLQMKLAEFNLGVSNSGAQNQIGLTIGGVNGQTYGIQFASNLAGGSLWSGLTNILLTSPTQTWIDPRPITLPQYYYRLVPGPIAVP